MLEIINIDNIQEYENFVWNHPKGHFMQSYKWGKVKDNWVWKAVISRDDEGKIRGTMAVLIRKLPGMPYTLMYSGRGPVCDVHDPEVIKELLEGAKIIAKQHKSYVLKIDPDVLSEDESFKKIMEDLGFKLLIGGKNFEGIQPQYVFRLTTTGKTEEDLMQLFSSKTRYNIRLADRKGVEVKICGKEALPDFSRIMLETGVRDGFVTRPQEYFEKLMDALGDSARLYMAFLDEKPIAGTLAIHYGNKVWYLYGASSNEYRNVMPNYKLQWNMILWALEKNCDIYDFRGVSGDIDESNPLYGLYRFKKGFNGDFCEFVGEYNYVFKPAINLMVTKGSSLYRDLRRKVFLRKNKS